MSEKPKTTEEQVERIEVIDGAEVLGYDGSGREEHSGENTPRTSDGMKDDLADNAAPTPGGENRDPGKRTPEH